MIHSWRRPPLQSRPRWRLQVSAAGRTKGSPRGARKTTGAPELVDGHKVPDIIIPLGPATVTAPRTDWSSQQTPGHNDAAPRSSDRGSSSDASNSTHHDGEQPQRRGSGKQSMAGMQSRRYVQEQADPARTASVRNGASTGRRLPEVPQEEAPATWDRRGWRAPPAGATARHQIAGNASAPEMAAAGASGSGRAHDRRRTGEHRGLERQPDEQQQQQQRGRRRADEEARQEDGREGELAQRAAREQERMGVSIVRRGRGSTATFFTQASCLSPLIQ